MDAEAEWYIMLLLADGNLPTGAFVASAGFESYVKHGFFVANAAPVASTTAAKSNQAMIDFIQDNLGAYAHSALPFVSDTHISVSSHDFEEGGNSDRIMKRIKALDDLYHSMTLNDVTRRASKAQGVALLTLFSKGLSRPQLLDSESATIPQTPRDRAIARFIDGLKLKIRREDIHGHLPICWGVLTAALGMGLERSQHLHLFLQARSLLSASIRLNTIGPYAAQQLLLHVVKGLVEGQINQCKDLRSGLQDNQDGDDERDGEVLDNLQCAVTTWPLGEILAARHDLQHSRIFNS